MEALQYHEYGDLDQLRFEQKNKPALRSGYALVRIKAIGLNPRDIAIRKGAFKWVTGRSFPKLTGADFSGEIVGLPAGNTQFKVGEEVFGYYESPREGVSAEIASIPLRYMTHKPAELEHTVAASLGCAYLTALQTLRDKMQIRSGQRLLVYGAAGGVGTAAMQLGHHMGAKVIAVSHSRNEAYCREQGAAEFIAYDQEDVFESVRDLDAFFQVFSNRGLVYSSAKKTLKRNGVFVTLIPDPKFLWKKWTARPKFDFLIVRARARDLDQLASGIKEGALTPHLHEVFSWRDYQEAFRVLKEDSPRGKLVLTL
jgi:NADPH:quinone reductase-like Zn-dependent oxidoreductase